MQNLSTEALNSSINIPQLAFPGERFAEFEPMAVPVKKPNSPKVDAIRVRFQVKQLWWNAKTLNLSVVTENPRVGIAFLKAHVVAT